MPLSEVTEVTGLQLGEQGSSDRHVYDRMPRDAWLKWQNSWYSGQKGGGGENLKNHHHIHLPKNGIACHVCSDDVLGRCDFSWLSRPENTPPLCIVRRAIGKKAIKNYVPMPPTGDVLKTSADVSLASRHELSDKVEHGLASVDGKVHRTQTYQDHVFWKKGWVLTT